jgi:hypothetical protein
MKVKCLFNTGEGLSEGVAVKVGSKKTGFPIKVGEVCIVYGQMIWKRELEYLIQGTFESLPSWYPAEMFEVVDSQQHFEWYFRYDRNKTISAIWGFQELVEDEDYLYDLEEREKYAIEIFLKRKKEMEEFFKILP